MMNWAYFSSCSIVILGREQNNSTGHLFILIPYYLLSVFSASSSGGSTGSGSNSTSITITTRDSLKSQSSVKKLGFSKVTDHRIASVCDCEIVPNAFVARLLAFEFRPPHSVAISNELIGKVASKVESAFRNRSMRVEMGRRNLVAAIMDTVLDDFNELFGFEEEVCVSALIQAKGPVDFLVGSLAADRERPDIKAFVVECKKTMNSFRSHFPQWLGELSAVMNGGDYSQGALTDGYQWVFATLTREDPSNSAASASAFSASAASSASACSKPKLVMSYSQCITVITPNNLVDVAGLREVCQYLHVCFSDGFQKMRHSHVLVPTAVSTDGIDDAASQFATMTVHEQQPASAAAAAAACAASTGAVAASSDVAIAPPSGGT
jgi:hypothetical protein